MKTSKSPQQKFKKQNYEKKNFAKPKGDKHTESNIYSITIRCGNGLNLGNKTVQDVVDWFRQNSDHHILGVEKFEKECHFQGGIFCDSLKRQDNLRRSLNPLVIKMWEERQNQLGVVISSLKREQVAKNALCIKPHTDWEKLTSYCWKEGAARIHSRRLSKTDELRFTEQCFCEEHIAELSIHQPMSCPHCMPLPGYFLKNVKRPTEYYRDWILQNRELYEDFIEKNQELFSQVIL